MANINRDYLIVLDAKSSVISEADELKYYITDEHSQNLFVNLVVRDIERINKYVEVHDPEKYQLELHIVKPNNDIVRPHLQANLLSAEDALYEFELPKEAVDYIGTYKCELRVTYQETDGTTITTSNKFKYKVKRSIYNDLDSIQEAPQYPVVIQLFDKLSDINQYEEDRRANELTRQLAEQQRQTRFDALDADMVDSIQQMDDKVVEVENRITTKEQAVDKLIADTKADINNYKVAKDQEIDDYKTAKDTEINTAIANQNKQITDAVNAQDSKIDTAIKAQNDKISVVENNDIVQNNRLDVLENRATTHESQLTTIENKNTEQDNRLDIAENRLANIGNDITNTMQPIIDEHTSRLEAIEAIDVAQNSRLDAIEGKNTEQDDRLLDIEKINKRQDMDLKCLFAESKNNMIDVTEEGNSIYLQNSTVGYTLIDEIKGNTLVNCNKEPDKELILNGNINTQGYSNITLTEGVDGGLVDVALEGNTMVNVCDQKDPVAITKSYTVETGNHVALQGEYEGKCRPVVTGNTLVNIYDMTKIYKINSTINDNIITFDTSNGGTWYVVNNKLPALKTSTKYTIILNIIENTIEHTDDKYLNIEGISNNSGFTSSDTSLPKGFTGIYKVALTTKDEFTANYLSDIRLIQNSGYTGKISFSVCILEGDYTNKPIPGYFEGLQSSFEDKVVTQEMVDNGEELAENLGKYKVDYVISKENGTIGQTKTFYLNSPLLEGDTIEQQGNNVVHVHRYGKVVFDGSEDEAWVLSTASTDNSTRFKISTPGLPNINGIIPMYCDILPIMSTLNTDVDGIQLCGDANECQIRLVNSKLSSADVAGFKQYLQSNPVTVVYKLVTPTYEVISQNDTILCDSHVNGHLDVDSAVPIEKVVFKNTGGISLKYLYPNTSYIIQFESDNVGKLFSLYCSGQNTSLSNLSVVKGLNKFNVTTLDSPVYSLVLDGIGFNASNIVVTEATDQNFGYFEGMKSVGECEDLKIVSSNSDSTLSNTQTLTHEPLRAVGDIRDKYVLIDGKWYIERNCGSYTATGNEPIYEYLNSYSLPVSYFIIYNNTFRFINSNCISNKFKNIAQAWNNNGKGIGVLSVTASSNENRVYFSNHTASELKSILNGFTIIYKLATPTYEPIDYNPFTVYSDTTHISNNSTIPCNMTIKNTGFNCLLKPSTTYTVSSNLGLNTVTTPSTLTEDCLRFYDTDTSTVTTMNNVTILEGDYTTGKPLPSHFSGIESAFEQEYDEAVGKYKVKIRVQNEDASKENYIEFYINKPLRGIGDAKDKVYVKDDKVVVQRNCGSVTFDGSDDENIYPIYGSIYNNKCLYGVEIPKLGVQGQNLKSNTLNTSNGATEYYDVGIYLFDDNVRFIINAHTLNNIYTISSFKQWLQQNPTTVVYQLAEPTYEEIEYNDVKLFIESFKNSTLFYNSNIPVTSKLYYSYSVPIVDTVAQTANVTDEQDVMIIDLATQVAVMEMMLM